MLINPNTHKLSVYEDTLMLVESLGVVGVKVTDPTTPTREWTVQSLFAPNKKRALGGIRIKAVDQKGFVSFINQRDFEVLIELGKPGEYCPWTGKQYPKPGSREWFGFCADDADMEDDLHERELMLRGEYDGSLPQGLELVRFVHTSQGIDLEELLVVLNDYDPQTGYGPDARRETIDFRWSSIEKTKIRWQYFG